MNPPNPVMPKHSSPRHSSGSSTRQPHGPPTHAPGKMALEIALNLLLARVKISKLPQRLWTPPSIMYDKLTTKTANIYQDFVDIRAQAQISVAAFFHTSWPLGVCFTAHRGCS